MHIIQDQYSKEYGILKKEPFKQVFRDTCKSLKKAMPSMTPDHVFYTEKELTVPRLKDLNDMANVDIPIVKFYNSDKKVYDRAMYTSENAKERYKIIKEINNLNEFFKFRKGKYE